MQVVIEPNAPLLVPISQPIDMRQGCNLSESVALSMYDFFASLYCCRDIDFTWV